jgi:sortase A
MFELHKPTGGGLSAPNAKGPYLKLNLWAWAERAALVIGIMLLAVYAVIKIESIVGSWAALHRFADLNSTTTTAQQHGGQETEIGSSRDLDSPKVDFSLWAEHRIAAYVDSLSEHTTAPLAVLRIPKVHLEVAVLDGTDDLTLNHAVGRIAGTARPGEPGNIGIAGHRDGFFRGLKEIGIGDVIELATPKGTDTYAVDELDIVTPRDTDVLRPRSVRSLTLVTCYPFYFIGSAPKRYIVKASLTGQTQEDDRASQ